MSRSRKRRSLSEDISQFVIDDDEMEDDEPGPSQRRKSKKSDKPKESSKYKKPREELNPEDEDDDLFQKYREVEYINRAMSVALSLGHKGVFKENELKPFLSKKNKGDWQDGLRTISDNMEHLFGYSLIYCGTSHCFTVRNNLIAETGALADLFEGKLNHEKIDDGGASERRVFQQKTKEEEALLFPVLTMIMMSGGDRQENWCVTGDVLEDFLLQQLEVPENTVSKLLSGKNPLFVRQGWVHRTTKELEGMDPVNHYSWGPRSIATVSASKLLEKYCLTTGIAKTNFASFSKQLKKYDYKNGTLQGEL